MPRDATATRRTHVVRAPRGRSGKAGLPVDEELLDGPTRLRERIMLGLRMKDGFDLESAAREIGTEPYPDGRKDALERLEARGRILRQGLAHQSSARRMDLGRIRHGLAAACFRAAARPS